ncbi:MAG TPA: hypothetical protein VIY68_07365 [Steroidobacteraceae bacterium]|jgi:hypothetical protein
MAPYFSTENLAKLQQGRREVHKQFAELRQRYITRKYKSDRAREYATHGFGRRLGTLVRAIEQVYRILPPEREDIPERDEVVDATIAIQSFVLNTFGCLDNLVWIWVYEKDIKAKDGNELDLKNVGFGNKQIRASFTDEFCAYLDSRQTWFEYLKSFRDSLVHRIPLYIPPYIVTPANLDEYNRLEQTSCEALQRADFKEYDRLQSEQKKLGLFRPWMTHSQFEKAPSIVFHSQLIADYVTIDEFGRTMLEELGP